MRGNHLFLAPCVNDEAQACFRKSVIKQISKEIYQQYTDQDYGPEVSFWAISDKAERYYQQMSSGDHILFYTNSGEYTHAARVLDIEQNPQLGKEVYSSNSYPVEYIIYLEDPFRIDTPSSKIHDLIEYNVDYPISFTKVSDDRVEKIRSKFGTIRNYLAILESGELELESDELDEEIQQIIESTSEEPILTPKQSSDLLMDHSGVRKRKLSIALRRMLDKIYDERCAVCGKRREHPTAHGTEAEVHRIAGKLRENFDIRNHLLLCRLHHWAFEVGWISLDDSFCVLTKNAEDREGYDEFIELEGEEINLPDRRQFWPHTKYLQEHRDRHGFDLDESKIYDDFK